MTNLAPEPYLEVIYQNMNLGTNSTLWIAISIGLLTGCNFPKFSATKDFETSITVNSPVEVIVSTFNGSIEVNPSESNEIQLVAHMKAFGESQEQAESRLESLVPSVDTQEKSVTIRCEKPGDAMFSMDSVSLELKIPPTWPLRLTTSNGIVTSTGSRSPLTVKTSNGQIKVINAIGNIELQTSNGAVSIEDSMGRVQAESSNGSIKLVQCTLDGNSQLDTSNGAISVALRQTDSISIDARTSNGSIKFDEKAVDVKKKSSTKLQGVLRGESSNGAPTIALELKTSNGSISIKSEPGSSIKTDAL
jgi:DUF4097 and DUF4098 domain-containing protein YvlB